MVRLVESQKWSNAIAIATATFEVTLNAAPTGGSCQFTQAMPESIYALQTPIGIHCEDFVDPELENTTPDSFWLELGLAECSSEAIRIDELVMVPKLSPDVSTGVDFTAELPQGCWNAIVFIYSQESGLATLFPIEGDLNVVLPSRHFDNMDSDALHFHWKLQRTSTLSGAAVAAIEAVNHASIEDTQIVVDSVREM